MTTSLAAPLNSWQSILPKRQKSRPFLKALEHIDYGRMTMVTPEGERLEFSGPENGPAAHLKLHDWGVLDELMARGEIGFADAYMDGRWESNDLAELMTFSLLNALSLEKFFYGTPFYALWIQLRRLFSANSLHGSHKNIMAHYDLGNEFYAQWLDEGMTYSSALFEGDATRSLENAQAAKYLRLLRKLEAEPGDHILEIGCGWGGFAEIAARCGFRVTALTLSPKQADFARERLRQKGLDSLTSIDLVDYRQAEGVFDHIVSIGMFEHVGEKYWPVYFNAVKKHLKPGGTAMVQSIMLDDHLFESLHHRTGFIEHYIFPGGMLPSKSRFRAAAIKAGLDCAEMYCFGQDYKQTLTHWLKRFDDHLDTIKAMGYDEPFIRLWRLYLSSCIASFATRRTDVVQCELKHAA